MEEFILAEDRDVYETLHPYGEVSSDVRGYQLVAIIDNGNISFENREGHLEYSQDEDGYCCNDFVADETSSTDEISISSLDVKEFQRLFEYLKKEVA